MDSPSNTTNTNNAKDNKKLFGILSYLGPLVLIPLLVERENAFVKFHVKQGLVLLSIEIILSLLTSGMRWPLWELYRIIHLAILVFVIIGIINVMQGREKELPFIGSLARYFPV